jgi:lipoic acid synthetase
LEAAGKYPAVRKIVEEHRLHTICSSGRCPNIGKCWNRGVATFMILGDICTRSCKFCATRTGKPLPPDPQEPQKIADSIRLMQLRHCVITSVDRDDLPDRGAAHWAAVIRAIRATTPHIIIETLIPDFDAEPRWIDIVLDARPDIVGHNMETVEQLTPQVRSRAGYHRSLKVLEYVARCGHTAKSGMMVGLGETPQETLHTMHDARNAGVRLFTVGQYLQPTRRHLPVVEYITPAQFDYYRQAGVEMGFDHVASGPLVRSSFMAEEQWTAAGSKQQAVGNKLLSINFVDWGLIDYREAWERQRALAAQLIAHKIHTSVPTNDNTVPLPNNTFVFCEHPHVYTLGRHGKKENLLVDAGFLKTIHADWYHVDRGGDITYHGPGQIVGYPVLDLETLHLSLKQYIFTIEEMVIRTLQRYDLASGRLPGATGVWIDAGKPSARKICAIGVHASHYVTTHGFALNVNTDLTYYCHIHPCGFTDRGVTSIAAEKGCAIDVAEIKQWLRHYFLNLLSCRQINSSF